MNAHRTIFQLGAALTLASVVVLTGCSSNAANGSPDPESLDDKTYLSTAVTGPPIPGGGPLEVTFTPGRIAATAGCNRHVGEVGFNGDTLTAGALAATMMACPGERAGADAWVSELFAEPLTWSAAGDTLTLSRDGRRIEMAVRKNAELVGPTWTVTSIVRSSGVESSRVIEDIRPQLVFKKDGSVVGFGGCNSISGSAQINGSKIEFRGVATTKKTCGDQIDRVEATVLDTLRGTATYRIDGRQLSLTNEADPSVGLRLQTS